MRFFFSLLIKKLQAIYIANLIVFLKMDQFQCRGLTQNEIAMARSVFGNRIHYTQVKILNIPYLPWQPTHIVMAPNGNIFVHPQYFYADYSQSHLNLQALFIHELAHILQFQQHINIIFKGTILQLGYYLSFKHYNPYHYKLKQNKAYHHYNIKQQGDIARDIFLKKIPNIILETASTDNQ